MMCPPTTLPFKSSRGRSGGWAPRSVLVDIPFQKNWPVPFRNRNGRAPGFMGSAIYHIPPIVTGIRDTLVRFLLHTDATLDSAFM